MATGEDVEVTGFEFEDDGAGDAGLFAGGCPGILGEAHDHGFQLGDEGRHCAKVSSAEMDLAGAVGNDCAVVDAASQVRRAGEP